MGELNLLLESLREERDRLRRVVDTVERAGFVVDEDAGTVSRRGLCWYAQRTQPARMVYGREAERLQPA